MCMGTVCKVADCMTRIEVLIHVAHCPEEMIQGQKLRTADRLVRKTAATVRALSTGSLQPPFLRNH